MAEVVLAAEVGRPTGSRAVRRLRREGKIPAVIYGHGREPQSLAVNARDTERLLGTISAESTVIELDVDDPRTVERKPA